MLGELIVYKITEGRIATAEELISLIENKGLIVNCYSSGQGVAWLDITSPYDDEYQLKDPKK